MTVAAATLRRTWLVTRRAYPWTYFTSTVLTGALTIVLAWLAYHSIGAGRVSADFVGRTGSADYVGYVAAGAVAFAFTTRLLLWVAKALIGEEREGTLGALIAAPARRLPYLLGFAGFAAVSTLAEVAALCAVARALDVRLPSVHAGALVVAAAVFTVAVFAMSVLVGVVMLVAGEAHVTQNTLFVAIALVCGFTFPRSYLPAEVAWLGDLLPVTAALEAVRAALAGGAAPVGALLTSLAVSAVHLLAGRLLLPVAERRAVERMP